MNLNLEKKAEIVGLQLAKKGINTAPTMRVGAAIDISGSMGNEFRDGDVQSAFDQCLGIAVKFDDNGEIDVWAFNTQAYQAPSANEADYGTYIGVGRDAGYRSKFGFGPGGGTNYAPCLEAMVKHYFPNPPAKGLFGFGAKKAPQGEPAMVLFFTDGDPGDSNRGEAIIKKCSEDRTNIYFNLIGVGNDSNFPLLRQWADRYDNCGFTHLHSIKMSDEEIYASLINDELIAFIKGQGVPA